MDEPFVGSTAVAEGRLVKSALRTNYTKLFRDVYVSRGTELTPQIRARAGWLWSGRRGIVAGLSASAMHGAKWIDSTAPIELIHFNRNPAPGLLIRGGRFEEDEITITDGIPVTTPVRTALDLACWYPTGDAVAAIDALTRATDVEPAGIEMLAQRYPGRRGIQRARTTIDLVDPGAQSPQETWLRVLLIDAGLPRPRTQIPVRDEFGVLIGYLDMGWEDVRVAVEYDGDQHRIDRRQYNWDIRRRERLEDRGWIIIRVVAGDRPANIVRRVRGALARRTSRQSDACSRRSR